MNNEELETVHATTFLGITVDSKIQWGEHITGITGKLSSAAYAVRKVRALTDVATARLVYFSYFHCIMSYGILMWGNAADIENVFVLQKRAVRAIYKLGARVSLRERFKDIGILTVASQYIYANIIYVRQNLDSYSKNSDVHHFNTRNKHKLTAPNYRLHKVHGSFVGLCVRIYNRIPVHLLELTDSSFKNKIKEILVKKAYYNVNDYFTDKRRWQL